MITITIDKKKLLEIGPFRSIGEFDFYEVQNILLDGDVLRRWRGEADGPALRWFLGSCKIHGNIHTFEKHAAFEETEDELILRT
jgi:hypothetical protein